MGYLIVATIRTDTLAIWDYGSLSSFANLAGLLGICLALFASFIAVGGPGAGALTGVPQEAPVAGA